MKRRINLKSDYNVYKNLKEIIQWYKPHIVHTHASKSGTLGRLSAIHCSVKVIVHTFHGHVFHSYFSKINTLIYKSIEKYLAGKSSAIITISNMQKHELVNIHHVCNNKTTHVIPLGFDLQKFQTKMEEKRMQFRNQFSISDETIVISIVGRLVPIKNHNLFLKALKNVLSRTDKKIHAFIIGDGELRESIEKQAQELGIAYNTTNYKTHDAVLTFTSWIKEIDIAMAGSDIIALTSHNEGTPVSLIEAQAANKVVITTNVGGVQDIILPDITGFLCENNAENFSRVLLKLIESEYVRNNAALHASDFVIKQYSYKRLVNDVDMLYKSLLH